ncbi:MAG: hypothetical protein ACMUHY_05930 [Thermoplasmatota archaeon]
MHRSETNHRTAYMIVTLLLMSAVIPLISSVDGLTFGKDVQIKPYEPDNRDQKNFDIASWGSGDTAEVYIVYEDYAAGFNDPHIYFQKSANGGSSWQIPFDFIKTDPVSGDKQIDPVIDIYDAGSSKVIAVAYLDSTYRAIPALTEWVIVVRVSLDNGTSWSTDRLVTPDTMSGYPSSKIKEIDMTFDPYGNLFVVWTNVDPANAQIDIAYSTDLGLTWSNPEAVKTQPEAPDQNWAQKKASIAANGQYVVVGWEINFDYKPDTFMTRASTSNLAGYPILSFETPWRIPKPVVYPMYQTYLPNLEADTNAFHMTWWDFSTDASGSDNGDISKDRPSIKYTRSTDNGASWSVGGGDNIIVNTSQNADKWHGRPDIGLGPDGTISISWMDYTLGHTNIFTTSSTDGGSTWSRPARVNDHAPTVYKDEPRVAVDSGGDSHVIWWERVNQQADMDLKHARTIINQAPEQIDDLKLLIADERYAIVSWTSNLEPDFKMYKTYISAEENFIISDVEWPDGPLYNQSTNQLMNIENYNKGLSPDTQYYVKLVIEDQEGLTSTSNEVGFRTRPVNKAPSFTKDVPTIYLEEDESREKALNFSHWKEMGWIIDDAYNGYTELQYDVEAESLEPNLTVRTSKIGLDNPYWYFDIFTKVQNWFGKERFRFTVTDMGKDGGFGTGDEKTGYSNWFTVQVNSTNDLPIWSKFQDLTTGFETTITPHQKELRLLKKDVGCLEGMPYTFAITSNDIDGDFLEYTTNMPDRIDVEVDGLDPQHKSKFTILPTNDDVPELNITITASDLKGGLKDIVIYIPVENVNNAPYYLSVDGEDIEPTGDFVEFEVYEKGTLTFNVSAGDIDFGDVLTLRSNSDRPTISKTSPSNWTVTVNAIESDVVNGFINFGLELLDLQKTDLATLQVNITILNIQDPPEWVPGSGKISVDFVTDREDMNEWGNQKGGSKLQAEWGENVRFEGFARDKDRDDLNYTWSITNENSGETYRVYGNRPIVRFYPSNGNVSILQSEKFIINLSVSDGHSETANIWYQIQQWVWSDDDNDNDGMPDKREIYFWRNLDHKPDVDEDNDGYTNIQEIGFQVPQYDEEKKIPYSIRSNEVNPLDPEVYPGHPKPAENPEEQTGDKEGFFESIPSWVYFLVLPIVVIVLIVVAGMVIVIRMARKKEEEEDEELEKRVADMERRQQELSSLYGVQKAGDAVGPDQSTLDDLTLDLGGQIYHEEGKQSLVSEKKKAGQKEAEKVSSGPMWESGTGPKFEETAPGLTFGESMEMDTMEIDPETTEIGHDSVDEDALEDSMGALLSAADDYDEEAVKNAGGGNVLVGAVPMEDQIRMKSGDQAPGGPRRPPPGQEPPSPDQMPPGQAPPTMQQGMPQAKPVLPRIKKPEEE